MIGPGIPGRVREPGWASLGPEIVAQILLHSPSGDSGHCRRRRNAECTPAAMTLAPPSGNPASAGALTLAVQCPSEPQPQVPQCHGKGLAFGAISGFVGGGGHPLVLPEKSVATSGTLA